MEGKLIIFAAPSGSGKSTIINSIMADGGDEELNLHFSVSATSRAPRGEEQNGVEYFSLARKNLRQRLLTTSLSSTKKSIKISSMARSSHRWTSNWLLARMLFSMSMSMVPCVLKDFMEKGHLAFSSSRPALKSCVAVWKSAPPMRQR